jgi:hypothetical protein
MYIFPIEEKGVVREHKCAIALTLNPSQGLAASSNSAFYSSGLLR